LYGPRIVSPVCCDAACDSYGLSRAPRADEHPPGEPAIRAWLYSVGSVTKKLCSCQQNQPLKEDISYCFKLALLLSAFLFKVRRHSPTRQCHAKLCVDNQTVVDWSQFCRNAMSNFILSFLMLFLLWLVRWGTAKIWK